MVLIIMIIMILDASKRNKISSPEAMWIFKVVEQHYSLKSCDSVPKLFHTISSDNDITKRITMWRQKTHYFVSDGLGPPLQKSLYNDIASSERTFTVMFDKTSVIQNRKQMDGLIPYWKESEGSIVTQYLMSIFWRATGTYIVDLFICSCYSTKVNKNIHYSGMLCELAIWWP